MPPRRHRITRSKKPRKQTGGDPDAPTDDEWKQMHRYGYFVVNDADGEPHMFGTGCYALVLPFGIEVGTDLELHDYWIVKIRDIRARSESKEEVWARCQWYYSPQDVAAAIKSFDPTPCAKNERIFSDHYDYIHTSAFDGLTTVIRYREGDIDQEDIPDDAFFCRYELEYRARRIQPKPGSGTCICNCPYNPCDPAPDALMHFCPRPSCRRFYHQACLLPSLKSLPSALPTRTTRTRVGGGKAVMTLAASVVSMASPTAEERRSIDLLCASPETDDTTFALGDLVAQAQSKPPPPKKRKRERPPKRVGLGVGGRKGKSDTEDSNEDSPGIVQVQPVPSTEELLEGVPESLKVVAQQPIVRGAAYRAGGVAGNVRVVVRARKRLYAMIEGRPLDDDDEDGDEEGMERAVVRMAMPALVCPTCQGPI